MKKIGVLLSLLTYFTIFTSYSQQNGIIRCYTVENEAIRRAQNPDMESKVEFEQWISNAIEEKKKHRIIGGVYQIPVVFHVVYTNGDAVGTGTNISQAALQSQIDVLNEDFRRIVGSNGYNTNPVGADCEIEFCLAQRKPDGTGFPPGEPGVDRISSSAQGWGNGPFSTTFIDNNIKPATSWDPSQYMNIWITDISSGILGYAQFPTSPLGGMDCGSQSNATDGVVFLYSSIGKSSVTGFPPPYNEGRTATHEIGHWLGLRHIWGDGGCNVDDFCNDTPEAGQANYNCPTGTNSCTAAPDQGPDMIENYMDYTDDACMNIFTQDQKMRMRTVLESSPIRRSLINSDACIPPSANDVSVIDVLNPVGDNCAGSIVPVVVIKNRGSSNLTSATINYTIDNGSVITFSYSGNIAPGATDNVSLPNFSTPLGIHTFTAYSTLPNGTADPNPLYDTVAIQFSISNGYDAPFAENFDEDIFPPTIKWTIDNPGNDCSQWQGASGTSIAGTFNNKAAQFPGYDNNSGNTDNLITPIFILPCNASAADIQFDVAYQRRTSGSNERLYIEISEDCGTTWNATPIYDKSGTTLQTIASTSNSYFTPEASSDWRTETIDLTSFITSTSKSIQFRFRAEGNDGNNIYVDNFKFNVTSSAEIDVHDSQNLAVLDEGYFNFGVTAIGGTSTETFTVVNTGNTNLTLATPITVTGSAFSLATSFGSTTIAPGDSTTFQISFNPSAGGNFSGNVSFGTNDCDENPYNFVLEGEGDNSPPVADFSASPLSVCVGSSVSFSDNSTSASAWSWNFGDVTAIPATSTLENPTVVYNTPGTYTVTLTATNAFGNDTETKTAYITVTNGGSTTLPISEGFVSTTFPPNNWTITNLAGPSATWNRTTDAGYTPTTGNAMMFDNANNDDRGDNDLASLPTLNLSSYSSVQLTFDVAYARYNASYSDGLQVIVEYGCGSTTTDVVYDKQGSTLATAPDVQSPFTPTSSEWRSETVDLSAYAGYSNVVVSFKNIAGYGNRLFVDNVNLTGVTATNPPVANFTASSTIICEGGSVTFTDASTNSPTGYTWSFTGGTPNSSSSANPTVVYNTAGTYNVTLTVSNADGTDDTTVTNMITVNAIPTITSTVDGSNCGTGTVNLSANASGGTISWYANTTGGSALGTGTNFTTPSISSTTTYYVETTENGCTSPTRTAVTATISPQPVITIGTVNTPSSCGNNDASIVVTGSGIGNLSWTGTSSGNANSITLPYTITGLTAGGYDITFDDGTCQSASVHQSINDPSAPPTPTISASGPTTFCSGGSVVLTSSSATDNLWSTGETTQTITVNSSQNVSVTVGTTCTSTSVATNVVVNSNPPVPTISASGPTTFCSGESVVLSSSSASGNAWSTSESTQDITVSTSGSYSVTVSNANGCQSTSASTNVTVNTPPTVTAIGDSICNSGSVTLSANTTSGTLSWYANATGGAVIGTGSTYTTPNISSTTTYYVEATDNGCTSPRTAVTATILSSYNNAETYYVCYGSSYTFPDGTTQNNITSDVDYFSNLTSVMGCDSIIHTFLLLQTVDTSVTITANSLVVGQAGAQYQWISCKDMTNVSGATFQSFTPSDDGEYAVIVTINGCSAQSSCYSTDHTSIKEETQNSSLHLSLYPNPSTGKVALQFSNKLNTINVVVLSVSGKLILDHDYSNTDKIDFNLTELAAGVYYFKVRAKETVEVIKYVKEK